LAIAPTPLVRQGGAHGATTSMTESTISTPLWSQFPAPSATQKPPPDSTRRTRTLHPAQRWRRLAVIPSTRHGED
jgi:hypothetical protein